MIEEKRMELVLKKGDVIYDAYGDLFRFHRDFGIPEKNDEYWDELLAKASEITNRYKGTEMEEIITNHLVTLMNKLNKEVQK